MNAPEYIQRQIQSMRSLCDAALRETTDAQFNWTPPGMANSISAAVIHATGTEDRFINEVLQGNTRLWETGNWSDKVGLQVTPGRGQGWEEIKQKQLAVATVLDYIAAVRANTDAYLATLTASELERKITLMGAERQVADVLAILITHTLSHMGEVAALKGMQGVKGLPF
jgi:uncharacterized damage-inducible protein DinB